MHSSRDLAGLCRLAWMRTRCECFPLQVVFQISQAGLVMPDHRCREQNAICFSLPVDATLVNSSMCNELNDVIPMLDGGCLFSMILTLPS